MLPFGNVSNDKDRMTNSVDPDQTAFLGLQEQSYLGLHCLPRPARPKTKGHYHDNNNNKSNGVYSKILISEKMCGMTNYLIDPKFLD